MSEFGCKYFLGAPPNIKEWEDLVELSGNPYQSIHFDKIEAIYGYLPVYFICTETNILVGAIKIYIYESKKLPVLVRGISKTAQVISEPSIHTDFLHKKDEITNLLIKSIEQFFTKFNPATFISKTSLGLPPLTLKVKRKEIEYGIAYIDLKRNFEEIYSTFSSNARQECRTAVKKNVKVEKTNNIDESLELFNYARTLPGFTSASNKYLTVFFEALNKNNMCDVWLAWYNNEPVTTVFVAKKGKNCFYEFGTSKRTNSGSGYFIHAEIIKYYNSQGYEKYYLGQVATTTLNNPKFEHGITFFKKQFNPIVLNGYKYEYVYSHIKKHLWKILIKLMIKK